MRPRPFGQFYAAFLLHSHGSELRQAASKHRPAHGASREAVQPVVVVVFRLQLPFVHRAAATGSLDPIFGGQVFRKELMNAGDATEEREGAFITDSHREASMDEALPKV